MKTQPLFEHRRLLLGLLSFTCACAGEVAPALEGAAAAQTDKRATADDALDPGDVSCGEGPQLALSSSWRGLASPASELFVAEPRLTLEVHNPSRAPIEARVLFALDGPSLGSEPKLLGTLALAPGARSEVRIELDDLADTLRAERFSVGLRVFLGPWDVESRRALEAHHASALYLHPVRNGFAVYGDEVLRKAYRAGDYQGLLDDAVVFEQGARTERVIEGGAGVVGPRIITTQKIEGELR